MVKDFLSSEMGPSCIKVTSAIFFGAVVFVFIYSGIPSAYNGASYMSPAIKPRIPGNMEAPLNENETL